MKLFKAFFLIPILSLTLFACTGGQHGDSSANSAAVLKKNREIVNNVATEIIGKNNYQLVDSFYAENYTEHFPDSGATLTRADLKKELMHTRNIMTNDQGKAEMIIVKGDTAILCWKSSGTLKADTSIGLMQDKQISVNGISIFTLKNGKITDSWTELNRYDIMQQLGILPSLRELIKEHVKNLNNELPAKDDIDTVHAMHK